jgi:adenosine deaminase
MATSKPYAELHVHLEGFLDGAVLSVIMPQQSAEGFAPYLQFDSFAGFLAAFKYAVSQLETPAHYRVLARAAFAHLHSQGIVYAEIIHSAGVCLWRGMDTRAIVEALLDEGRRAPLTVRWVLDGVRQFGPAHSIAVAELAARYAEHGVIGFGVGGDETGCPAEELRPAFHLAARHGLRLLPHAGETSSAENVWDALILRPDRIGHGIRAAEDPRLLEELARRQIPLDVSLTSNVLTAAVPSYAEHPLGRILAAGVPVTLNTDDPAFFRTTLAQEFAHAARLGLAAEQLEEIRLNAFRYAAAPLPGFV